MEKKEIIFFLVLLMIPAVQAINYSIAEGGNITPLHMDLSQETEVWQGFAGRIRFIAPDTTTINATGGEVNGTIFNFSAPCTNPTSVRGFILFSNSSTPPAGLAAGNLTQLNNFLVNRSQDDANRTFTTTSTFNIGGIINNVPTTYTFVNQQSQNTTFREGYFNDASGNLVFAVEVDMNSQGYNTSFFDFQAIIPVYNKTETQYYITTDLDIVCPRPPSGGGGGGGGGAYCSNEWNCTAWSECINGIQERICTEKFIVGCQRALVRPAEARICIQEISMPQIVTEKETVEEIRNLEPIKFIHPKIVEATPGFEIITKIENPNEISIEDMRTELKIEDVLQNFKPLHKKPLLYSISGMNPLQGIKRTKKTETEEHKYRLNPRAEERIVWEQILPLTTQKVKAAFETYTGELFLGRSEAEIEMNKENKVIVDKNKFIEVKILINNKGKPTRYVEVELDLNEGRRTKYTEVYTLRVPKDEIALYGHIYDSEMEFDDYKARINGIEV